MASLYFDKDSHVAAMEWAKNPPDVTLANGIVAKARAVNVDSGADRITSIVVEYVVSKFLAHQSEKVGE